MPFVGRPDILLALIYHFFYSKVSLWWHHVWWRSKHAIQLRKLFQHVLKPAVEEAKVVAQPGVGGQRVRQFFVRNPFKSLFKLFFVWLFIPQPSLALWYEIYILIC